MSATSKDTVLFECPDCGRTLHVDRLEDDPPTGRKCILQCDRCDDGDFHESRWLDENGKDLEP